MTSEEAQDAYMSHKPVKVFGLKAYITHIAPITNTDKGRQVGEMRVEFDSGRFYYVFLHDVCNWVG